MKKVSDEEGKDAGGADPSDRRMRPVRLKDVAADLDLSPATVSLILNRSARAKSIPEETHRRVFEAAKRLRYRPNQLARSLRSRRSDTIGVLVPEISEGYEAAVLAGIEERLTAEHFFYFVASHGSDPGRLAEAAQVLLGRQVEGLILANTRLDDRLPVPVVSISGHEVPEGVHRVVIDHEEAARMALDHLVGLGHRRIAFFRGPTESGDSRERWRAITSYAAEIGVPVEPGLVETLTGREMAGSSSAEIGYQEGFECAERILGRGREFTALFAFNDVSAIGAMRALLNAGLDVPGRVSVLGFDDIQSAAFLNPSLTTVRQPLREMGQMAARNLLELLRGDGEPVSPLEAAMPELVIRESTGRAPR